MNKKHNKKIKQMKIKKKLMKIYKVGIIELNYKKIH